MQGRNLPALDARYWAAILAASLVRTTLGDFVSQSLGLGYFKGLLPLGALLAIDFLAERRVRTPSEAYYWIAIVLTRTGATNLADLATHELRLNYVGVAASLAVLLVITLLGGRRSTPRLTASSEDLGRRQKVLPSTDARYWAAILIASTLGTTLGDFVSDGLGLGVRMGSVLLGGALAVILSVQDRVKSPYKAFYWVSIVTVRTTGTDMGDFLSMEGGLHLGFLRSAIGASLLLVAILALWKKGDST